METTTSCNGGARNGANGPQKLIRPDVRRARASWFETAHVRLFTMREMEPREPVEQTSEGLAILRRQSTMSCRTRSCRTGHDETPIPTLTAPTWLQRKLRGSSCGD